MADAQEENKRGKNRRTLAIVFAVVAAMGCLSFAAVPLYDLFCRTTGFGGTTQVSAALPETVLERSITVKFDAGTARDMPWRFTPERREIRVRLGEKGLASYRAENRTDRIVAGTALYNVVPEKAGKYFQKIQCFCFDEQILGPGKTVSMPVVFYVDPKLGSDPDMADVDSITLSYTFFRAGSSLLDKALEAFYNGASETSAK